MDKKTPELRLDSFGNADPSEFADAVDLASDQDTKTWILDTDGRRIAALVPVEVAERDEQWIADLLATPAHPERVLGHQVRVTGPTGATWTGRAVGIVREPSMVIEYDGGPRVHLPLSFRTELAE